VSRAFELPPELDGVHRRAIRLEWITLAYLATAIAALYLTLGNSQAMKAAWIEDSLSLLPPIAFLVANRIRTKPASDRFPWGRHRAVSIGYLGASLALLAMGSWLLVDSGLKLITAEHPPIGVVSVFGQTFWLGWLMLPALAWSAVPAYVLGRMKLSLASQLHDKVLYADAKMNKADWMTAGAAGIGVIGIGFGLWWADAVAALAISLDIAHDGWTNVRAAARDLMDEQPSTYDDERPHPLNRRIQEELEGLPWVADVEVRMREEGHVFEVEAFLVPVDGGAVPLERLEDARERLRRLDWKLRDVVVAPVAELPLAGEPKPPED
jgi:cation diffusion facilitator family transporter